MFNLALIIVCFIILIRLVDLFQWKNLYARNAFIELSEEIGSPQIFNEKPDGAAIWTSSLIAKRIIIFDKPEKPMRLYVPIELFAGYECIDITHKVRNGRLAEILQLSSDISYDPITKLAIIKSYNYKQSLALIGLMMKLTTSELTLDWIQKKDLLSECFDKSICPSSMIEIQSDIEEYLTDYVC